jgi:ABC-type nitrate/sulfonate/bicarbonate transport system substrate-binding protein
LEEGMKMKKKICIIISLLIFLLVVTGCATTGDSVLQSSKVSADRPQKEADVVKVGYLKILATLYYEVAKQKGYFAEENIIIKEQLLESSNLCAEALVQGHVDVVPEMSVVPIMGIEARQPGNIELFTTQLMELGVDYFTAVIALDGSGIEELSDLEGRKVGVFPGSTASAFLTELLVREGVDASKVELVKLTPPQQLNALNSGSIDALFAYQPVITIADQQGNMVVVHKQVYASVINFANVGTGAFSARFVQENPDVAERFRNALLKAQIYMHEHPDEARQIAKEYFGFSDAVAQEVPLVRHIPSENANFEAYEELVDILYDNGIIPVKVDAKSIMYKGDGDERTYTVTG